MNKYIFLVVIPRKKENKRKIRALMTLENANEHTNGKVARSAFAITLPNAYFKRFSRRKTNDDFKNANLAPIKTDEGVK